MPFSLHLVVVGLRLAEGGAYRIAACSQINISYFKVDHVVPSLFADCMPIVMLREKLEERVGVYTRDDAHAGGIPI